jgi:hypothetical protein
MAEGLFVDVHYQGIELGRRLQFDDVVAAGAYLHSPAPMPVGTILVLDPEVDAELTVRVTRVSEQIAGSERPAGMFVAPHELSDRAQARWDQWADGKAAAAPPAEAVVDPSVNEATVGADGNTSDTEKMPAQSEPETTAADTEKMAAQSETASEDETKGKGKAKKKRTRRKKAK